jgi:hypothetical protein
MAGMTVVGGSKAIALSRYFAMVPALTIVPAAPSTSLI